jgi:hypothetical protein
VTEEVFEALLPRFGVFPRLKDILLYQGRRSLEVEVGPPRLQWNLRPLAVVGGGGTGVGFGMWALAGFFFHFPPDPSLVR